MKMMDRKPNWDNELLEVYTQENGFPETLEPPFYMIIYKGYPRKEMVATKNKRLWEQTVQHEAIKRVLNKDKYFPFLAFVVSEAPKVVTSVTAELK
jgi:hypothetical protein